MAFLNILNNLNILIEDFIILYCIYKKIPFKTALRYDENLEKNG